MFLIFPEEWWLKTQQNDTITPSLLNTLRLLSRLCLVGINKPVGRSSWGLFCAKQLTSVMSCIITHRVEDGCIFEFHSECFAQRFDFLDRMFMIFIVKFVKISYLEQLVHFYKCLFISKSSGLPHWLLCLLVFLQKRLPALLWDGCHKKSCHSSFALCLPTLPIPVWIFCGTRVSLLQIRAPHCGWICCLCFCSVLN